MGVRDLDPNEENQLFRELLQWQNQRYVDQRNAGVDLADKIDYLTTQAPYANPDLIMSAAEGWRDGVFDEQTAFQMLDEATNVEVASIVEEAEQTGGWRNTASEWLKTGSRWTFAGLEIVPQLFTNTVTRFGQDVFGGPGEAFPGQTDPSKWYTPPDTESFFDGWFASTDFGAMLSGENAGTGYFIGEKAKEKQLQAVKAYRGMYAGEAITVGRGLAGTFFEPDSRPYNVLSGIVDATQAIVVPSLPLAGTVAKGVSGASRAAGVGRLAGLTNYAEPFIDYKKANAFLDTRAGTRVAERISKITNMEDAMSVFPKVDHEFWSAIIEADSVDAVKNLLRTELEIPTNPNRLVGAPRGVQGLGIRPGLQDVRDINLGAVSPVRGGIRRGIAKSRTLERAFAAVPGRELAIDVGGLSNPQAVARELTTTLTNARDYMKLVKMDPDKRNKILLDLSNALKTGNRAAARNVISGMTDDIIDSVATHQSVLRNYERDFLKQMFTKYQNDVDEFALYGFIDDAGKPDVLDDLVAAAMDGTEIRGVTMVMNTAGMTSEMKKFATYFPDPRNLRRVTTQFAPLWAKAMKQPELYGDPKTWLIATEFVMNKVFRTAMLLTGGYMTRNMIESTMRQLATPGIKPSLAHPLEYIMSLSRYKYKGTVEGDVFTQTGARLAGDALSEWEEATGAVVREMQLDPSFAEQLSFRNGVYSIAVKGTKNDDYITGVATEIRLLANDEVARQLADGADIDEVVDWLKSDAGKEYMDQISDMWSGRTMVDANGNEFTGSVVFRKRDANGNLTFEDQNLYKYVDQINRRVALKTGGHQSLRDVIANWDRLGEFVTPSGEVRMAFKNGVPRSGPVRRDGALNRSGWGTNFDYTDEFLEEIRRIANDPTNNLPEHVKYTKPLRLDGQTDLGKLANAISSRSRHFFTYVFGKKEAFLNRSPVFRQFYYRKVRDLVDGNAVSREGYAMMYEHIVEAAIKAPDDELRLLKSLKPDRVTGRYTWNGFEIRPAEYKLRVKKAEMAVERSKKLVRIEDNGARTLLDDDWASRYVGGGDLWQKIVDGKNGRFATPEAGLTAAEASFVSKAFAMEETQKAFFNASQTSNFTDMLKIAIPFGAAWKEAMAYNLKQVALKPDRVRKIGQTVRTARDADPDNDGKSFIWTDPATGEKMFYYPFGMDIIPVATAFGLGTMAQTLAKGRGLSFAVGAAAGFAGGKFLQNRAESNLEGLPEAALAAPAKSLSQSLQILPGFGPAIQFPAGILLGDKPQFQDALEIIAPFGGFTSITDAVTPKWAQRLAAAITADPEHDRFFAELYIDSGRALYATGQFDATNPLDMERLRNQAGAAAQSLLILRALGQFTGPARPEIELRVPTKYEGKINIGDVEIFVKENIPTAVLASTVRALQEEDYDNAVQTFLRTFGPETAWFLPGLSEASVEGLQATDVFGKWELENADVIGNYPKVYGYFAPVGGEFDFQTYLRQINSKKRIRTTSLQELQQDAEAVVGRALYMDAVRFAGPEIDQTERQYLRAYRAELQKNYPGYGTTPIDLRENVAIMNGLRDMAQDPRMADNPVAQALNVYLDARTSVLNIGVQRDGYSESVLTRASSGDLRQYLRAVANDLMVKYPEFGRVYSRVLFDEVDESNAR